MTDTTTTVPGESVTDDLHDASQETGDGQGWRNEQRHCEACGTSFQPVRRAQVHCRARCRQRAYVKRRMARPPA